MVTLLQASHLKKEAQARSEIADKLERIKFVRSLATMNLLLRLKKFNAELLKRGNLISSPKSPKSLAEVKFYSFFNTDFKVKPFSVPTPPLPKNVHAKCGDIFQVGPRYNLDEQSLSAECDKVKCVLSCKNAGASLKATPSKLPKNGEMIIKCGKKGFAPKKVKATCIGGSPQRALGGLFDDETATKQNNKTSCLNSIYEKYAGANFIILIFFHFQQNFD